jgi:hypothetical protein
MKWMDDCGWVVVAVAVVFMVAQIVRAGLHWYLN